MKALGRVIAFIAPALLGAACLPDELQLNEGVADRGAATGGANTAGNGSGGAGGSAMETLVTSDTSATAVDSGGAGTASAASAGGGTSGGSGGTGGDSGNGASGGGSGGAPEACGAEGQPCCPESGSPVCDERTICEAELCASCGAWGEACCETNGCYAGVCTVGSCQSVVEPNGIAVPLDSVASEVGLQAFFDAEGESIDAVRDADPEPGRFEPLGPVEVALVLAENAVATALAWYDANADVDTVPSRSQIFAEGTPIGMSTVISDASDASAIGFVLVANNEPVYYSEPRRNAFCSACSDPGYWSMALVYKSSTLADTYYLAFESWPGADATSWQGNDGDFNDFVFRVSGISHPDS